MPEGRGRDDHPPVCVKAARRVFNSPDQFTATCAIRQQPNLLLKDQGRSDACCLEVDSEVHTIGSCYELNAATQPKIPPIDRQYPFDLACSSPCLSINSEG